MVDHQIKDRCSKQGKKPFIVESTQAGIPLVIESASAEAYCYGPDDVVHTPPAFGADLFGASELHGVGITDVAPNSIAARAALKSGDVIFQFGDEVIEHPDVLRLAIDGTPSGQLVEVRYRRNQKEMTARLQF
jgi:S1-C subfamily serine protease